MSILDYQKDHLDSSIWDANERIKPGVKSYILSALNGFFVSLDIEGYKDFVTDSFIASSLASFFYREDTDMDVKFIIDTNAFIKYNPDFKNFSSEDIIEYLIFEGRKSYWLTSQIPGTLHPLDVYFFPHTEDVPANIIKFDSLYHLSEDSWIKKPKKLQGKLSPSYILNYAKDKAHRYLEKISLDINKAKRDTIDFLILRDYIKDLDKDDIKNLRVDFKNALNNVNDSIEELIEDTEIIKNLRNEAFSKKELDDQLEKIMGSINYSDNNLIFKIIQRYGYLRILYEISQVIGTDEVTPEEIPQIYGILQ